VSNSISKLGELIDALRAGQAPRADLAAWFVSSTERWLLATGPEPLHNVLGVRASDRRAYRVELLNNCLAAALRAFASAHPTLGCWRLAGDFRHVLRAYRQRRPAEPATDVSRALHALFALGLQIPESRNSLMERLQQIVVDAGVRDAVTSRHQIQETPMTEADIALAEQRWRAEFTADAKLREEFGDADTFVAYQRAHARGQVREYRDAAPRHG
jgi:hypothetical protein